MALLVNLLIGVLVLVLTALIWFAFYLRQLRNDFKSRNIPYIGVRLWKNLKTLTGHMNLFDMEMDTYVSAKATKAPIVACTEITGLSSLVVTDLDLMKRIMVKDADHFVNQRPFDTQTSGKYWTKMLFVMRDEHWKVMRSKMTPAFTTGKIKRMHQLFVNSSEKMNGYIKKEMGYPKVKSMDVDFFKVLFKYSMDVIASCAFGVDSQSWTTSMNEFSTFEHHGKNFEFKIGFKEILAFTVIAVTPKLADFLKLEFLDWNAQDYFANLVQEVVKHRRQTGQRHEDFLQLMIDIQDGVLKAEEDEALKSGADLKSSVRLEFDDDYLVANTLMFFLGGFDTTQTVLLFAAYSLALEQKCQEKLYQEIKATKEKHGGKLTYDAIFEMPYLDMVVYETMRMYPAASRTERECSMDYVVEETGLTIKKGEMLLFPAHGIHYDADYYPEPEKFIPERFSQEERSKRHQFTFLSFGYGPRSCIGMRFALLKVKAVIAQLVSEFQLDVCSKTTIPMKFAARASAKPTDGMWLRVTAREEN